MGKETVLALLLREKGHFVSGEAVSATTTLRFAVGVAASASEALSLAAPAAASADGASAPSSASSSVITRPMILLSLKKTSSYKSTTT